MGNVSALHSPTANIMLGHQKQLHALPQQQSFVFGGSSGNEKVMALNNRINESLQKSYMLKTNLKC